MFENLGYKLEKLKANRAFEMLVVSVIILAALLAGARTYDINPSAHRLLSFLDILITVFFVVEISLRFMADQDKRDFFKSGWNIFDTVIVLASLVPVGNSEMVIVGRLLRIFRVLRMVSMIPELRILLNSLMRALPQLGYVVLLMFIIFYIYAAAGSMLFGDINEVLWGDILVSMLTLFRVVTFEDWTDVMYETMKVYPLSWTFYLSFIFLNAFVFLNMMIGIVIDRMQSEHDAYNLENDEGELTYWRDTTVGYSRMADNCIVIGSPKTGLSTTYKGNGEPEHWRNWWMTSGVEDENGIPVRDENSEIEATIALIKLAISATGSKVYLVMGNDLGESSAKVLDRLMADGEDKLVSGFIHIDYETGEFTTYSRDGTVWKSEDHPVTE